MDVKWDYELKGGQRKNPVVYTEFVNLDEEKVFYPKENDIKKVFKTDGFKLQTWGRTPNKLENDPHYIGVRKTTPLHIDPRYPRYSHHLKLRVDLGIGCRGLDKTELMFKRGTFYILDTHSPHQVFIHPQYKKFNPQWNIAVSIDSHKMLYPEAAIQDCINYALENPF
tara:strand:+ start:888 stop:1391 length:504 start_codon:yes stop_codon:yes gene_type:complete